MQTIFGDTADHFVRLLPDNQKTAMAGQLVTALGWMSVSGMIVCFSFLLLSILSINQNVSSGTTTPNTSSSSVSLTAEPLEEAAPPIAQIPKPPTATLSATVLTTTIPSQTIAEVASMPRSTSSHPTSTPALTLTLSFSELIPVSSSVDPQTRQLEQYRELAELIAPLVAIADVSKSEASGLDTIVIANFSDYPIDLSEWTLLGYGAELFQFDGQVMAEHSALEIYVGQSKNLSSVLYWQVESESAFEDRTLILRDSRNAVVDRWIHVSADHES